MRIIAILFLLISSVTQGQVRYWTDPLFVSPTGIQVDSFLTIPKRNSLFQIPNSGKDSLGAVWYHTGQNKAYIRYNTGAKALVTEDGVSNIYNASGILTSNRLLTGKNNTYGLDMDSLDHITINSVFGFTNTSGSAAFGHSYIVNEPANIGLRIADPGVPYVDVTLQRSDTSFTVTVANKGKLQKLRMQQDTLSYTGQLKITGGSPGAGKVLTSDGAGLASWQSSSGIVTGFSTATDADYTVQSTDRYIILPVTTSLRTITLPAASGNTGREIMIKVVATGSGQWQTGTTGYVGSGQLGTPPFTPPSNVALSSGQYLHLVSDGSVWYDMK